MVLIVSVLPELPAWKSANSICSIVHLNIILLSESASTSTKTYLAFPLPSLVTLHMIYEVQTTKGFLYPFYILSNGRSISFFLKAPWWSFYQKLLSISWNLHQSPHTSAKGGRYTSYVNIPATPLPLAHLNSLPFKSCWTGRAKFIVSNVQISTVYPRRHSK